MQKSIKRLKFSLAWKLFPSARLSIRTANGVKVPLRARGDFASLEEIFVKRTYDALFEALPGPILSWVDLGCNAGLFSAWLYDRAGGAATRPDCRALLVEPGVCVATAREFVRINDLSGFQVVQACIGDGKPTTFYESKSSTRSTTAIKPGSLEKVRQVDTVLLSSLLSQTGFHEADLLKVDIEGSEKHVLAATDIFHKFRAGIIEWHAETTPGDEVVNWIKKNGGRITQIISQDGPPDEPLRSRLGMIAWVRN